MEKNNQQSILVKNALRKKEFKEKMEEAKKNRANEQSERENGKYKNIAKVFTRKERIEKVKFLSTQIAKFLEENEEVIFSDEIDFFTTILIAELKFKTGIK